MSIGIVVAGFILLYMYDFNSIGRQHPFVRKFFFLGSITIVVGTFVQIKRDASLFIVSATTVLNILLLLIFIGLLVYTLFFALPFDDTYKGDSSQICDTGVYALCRHPGVICFFLVYISLYTLLKSNEMLHLCIAANALNMIYIILQDCIIFPRMFHGYAQYQVRAPFLIPNGRSVKRCIDTLRG